MATIICQDCGAERTGKDTPSNTKYCKLCRLLRNLQYVSNKLSKCWSCETKFAPLNRNDVLCSKCDARNHPDSEPAECAMCRATASLIGGGVAVCWDCARDPDQRPTFLRAVFQKVERRKQGQAA